MKTLNRQASSFFQLVSCNCSDSGLAAGCFRKRIGDLTESYSVVLQDDSFQVDQKFLCLQSQLLARSSRLQPEIWSQLGGRCSQGAVDVIQNLPAQCALSYIRGSSRRNICFAFCLIISRGMWHILRGPLPSRSTYARCPYASLAS